MTTVATTAELAEAPTPETKPTTEIVNYANPMTVTEANDCVKKIKKGISDVTKIETSLRDDCLEFKRREGWKALGHSSMDAFAKKSMPMSRSTFYRLVDSGETATKLLPDMSMKVKKKVGTATDSAMAAISKLTLSYKEKSEVFKEAVEVAEDSESKNVDASHIRKAVGKMKKDGIIKPTKVAKDETVEPEVSGTTETVDVIAKMILDAEKLQRQIDDLPDTADPLGKTNLQGYIERIVATLQSWG